MTKCKAESCIVIVAKGKPEVRVLNGGEHPCCELQAQRFVGAEECQPIEAKAVPPRVSSALAVPVQTEISIG